ncbi:MAG: sulfur carrier protein ThiS [Bacillota bacterium]|jgi:sulfur carrier protein
MKLNGEYIALKEEKNLSLFLEKEGYHINLIAVLLNNEVVPRAEIGNVIINNDDNIEVLCFVGGG